MKKMIAMLLALAIVCSFAACGGTTAEPTTEPTTQPTAEPTAEPTAAPTEPVAANLSGTMEELVNSVITEQPVEFMGGVMPVDLTDTSEDGLWAIKNATGLDSAEMISDVAVFEPMMGSMAFSLVMVRVAEGQDAKTVAESMKQGIDPRKWICVEADDLKVAGFGDTVMLIMVSSTGTLTSQNFVDAFQRVCAAQVAGAQLDFVLE